MLCMLNLNKIGLDCFCKKIYFTMSAHQSKMRILLGQVIGTKMRKTAKVRVERLVLDKYLMQYFPRRTTVFAHDGQQAAKEGDVVLVKELPLPRSKQVKYMMERIIYSHGNVTDPITGKKCDAKTYRDEDDSPSPSDEVLQRQEAVDPDIERSSSEGLNFETDLQMERKSEGTPV